MIAASSPSRLCLLAAGALVLFGLLAGVAGWSGTASAKDGPVAVDAELVFAVDISFSMNSQEQRLQRDGYAQAINSPEFLDAIKAGPTGKVAVAYMQWSSSGDQNVVLDWTVIDGPDSAKAVAGKLEEAPLRRASRTSISGGIDAAAQMFVNNGYDSSRQIIDVSGDGPNNSGRTVTEARNDAVAKGIVINGLPLVGIRPYIGPADIKDLDIYYQDCVIGGPGAFMVAVHDTAAFVQATRTKLVREVAFAPPPPIAPIVLAQARQPRISCTIGEGLFRTRGFD